MKSSSGKYALITGAGGFLGKEAARTFARAGFHVSGIGHGQAPEGASLSHWVQADIDYHAVAETIARGGAPDVVIHTAGGSSVRAAHDSPLDDFQRTVAGTAGLLEAVRRHASSARLIMVSSAAVYGNSHHGPIREDSALDPISYYGAHKRMAEEMCVAANRHWQLSMSIVRFFSLYGAGLRKQIFWDLAERCSKDPERVDLGGTGDETRDFLHVTDASRLLLHLAKQDRREPVLIVNGGTGKAIPIRQAAEELLRACGANTRTAFDGVQRVGDPSHLVANTERLHACGFKPGITLSEGLAGFAQWHRQQSRPSNANAKSAGAAG